MKEDLPRILVVDDEPDMCWALENILRPAGYAVTTTTRGQKALELLAEESYAAAFVDAKLPDMDGLELASLIQRQSPRTGIVLVSGYFYEEDEMVSAGLDQGLFIGFIAKPFELEKVRDLARQAIGYGKQEGHVNDAHLDRRRRERPGLGGAKQPSR